MVNSLKKNNNNKFIKFYYLEKKNFVNFDSFYMKLKILYIIILFIIILNKYM